MTKKTYTSIFIFCLILLSLTINGCQNNSQVVTSTPSLIPSNTTIPTQTATIQPTTGPTALPYPQLEEIVTFGKGEMPQYLYTNDNTKIVTLDENVLRILDASDFHEIAVYSLSEPVIAGSVLPKLENINHNGNLIVLSDIFDDSKTYHNGIRIINMEDQSETDYELSYNSFVNEFIFTPDEKNIIFQHIYSGSFGPSSLICEVHVSGQINDDVSNHCFSNFLELSEYNDLAGPVISEDGMLIAAGNMEIAKNEILIWDAKTKDMLQRIDNQASEINCLAFRPHSTWLASAGNDGLVHIWDATNGNLLHTINNFTNVIVELKFSLDGRYLYATQKDQNTTKFDLTTWQPTPVPEPTPDAFTMQMIEDGYLRKSENKLLRFSPTGDTLALADGSIQIWDVKTHTLITSMLSDQSLEFAGITYSPDGSMLAAITETGEVMVWNVFSGMEVFSISNTALEAEQLSEALTSGGISPGVLRGTYGYARVAFSPDSHLIAFPNGLAVEIYDLQEKTKINTLARTKELGFPTGISFSNDGSMLYAVLDYAKDLAVWNMESGQITKQEIIPIYSNEFFNDFDIFDNKFIRGNYDDINQKYVLEYWHEYSGKVTNVTTNIQRINNMHFNADGNFFAAQNYPDKLLYLWDASSLDLVYIWEIANSGYITDNIFSFDDYAINTNGDILATTTLGQITLWNLKPYISHTAQSMLIPPLLAQTATPSNALIVVTDTSQPIQNVSPLTIPTDSLKDILPQNIENIELLGTLGKGKISEIQWKIKGQELDITSARGFYQLDATTLRLQRSYESDILICSSQILPDGKIWIAGYTPEGKVKVWDATHDETLVEFSNGSQPAISPDGEWLVYVVDQKGLASWNLKTKQPGHTLNSLFYINLSKPIFSPDGRYVAAIQSDRTIRIWDIKTGLIVNSLGGATVDYTDFSFSEDGKLIIGAAGGSVWIWSIDLQQKPRMIEVFENVGEIEYPFEYLESNETITSVTLSKDNKTLVMGTSQGEIMVYDTIKQEFSQTLMAMMTPPSKLALSPNNDYLIAVDEDGKVYLYSIHEGNVIRSTHEFSDSIHGLVPLQNGNIGLWMNNTYLQVNPNTQDMSEPVYVDTQAILAVSPTENILAGYTSNHVSLYNNINGTLLEILPDIISGNYQTNKLVFNGATFSLDGKKLVTFGENGIWMYSVNPINLVNHYLENKIVAASLSADGKWILISPNDFWLTNKLLSYQGAESIFQFEENLSRRLIQSIGNQYTRSLVSPDIKHLAILINRYLVSELHLFSTSSGLLEKKLELNLKKSICLAYNPSGTLIAVGMEDGNILLVDSESLEILLTFQAHPAPVTHLVFSGDGAKLISSGDEGVIKVWGLPQ